VSFVGHGWRSGQASDITGAASTATVTVISPTTFIRGQSITMTVTGTGFTAQTQIYAGFNPCATVFDSATQLRCTSFNTTPDNGQAGVINVGVRKPGEVLSGTRPFTAT
jgi:IPT/TIG domain